LSVRRRRVDADQITGTHRHRTDRHEAFVAATSNRARTAILTHY